MDETTLVNTSPIKDQNNLKDKCSQVISHEDSCKLSKTKVCKPNTKNTSNILEKRLEYNEITNNSLRRQKDITSLKQAIKIVDKYDEEKKTFDLIDKWRDISQKGLSYMMNSTLLKIDRVGGYMELRKKELEAEKRQIEYQLENDLDGEYENMIETEEFQMLPEDVKSEYAKKFEHEKEKVNSWKEKKFSELDSKLDSISNESFTMEELCKRLKVDFSLVFQSSNEN
ncbi:hypothetical protein TPHA_0A01030 [Tetrapisispora phaffii CBS 4417]|uniref:Meiosis protein 5 n=1 Tax=Tetrapisispora phaffii (strain ATCC 24235 / CBS 4417 / NBRC 1672 / NRRL Y-8282 / UCD 70-5) TaxID=1071381 RepID=G8BMR0_TETPH|nr:hypothetical protein TPHA_0A01030 [Tetrapisispora phaffii CBS 4417]CCE61188.1 hypothetical protein TPHA_0A01030 [Tetrapisispora phaffii CBS 4417]